MIVTLTHELRVKLLEAIKQGELDTDIFDEQQGEPMTQEDITREMVRLEMVIPNETLLRLSDLMRRYALGEISREEYTNERIKLNY